MLATLLCLAALQATDPVEEPPPPAALEGQPAPWTPRPAPPRPKEQDDDALPLRVGGAVCGGLLGWHIGGILAPLVTVPLLVVGLFAVVLCSGTLLASVSPTVLPLLFPFAAVSFSLLGMVVPLTMAVIGAKLGYDHAPTVVDSVAARTQRQGQMAY